MAAGLMAAGSLTQADNQAIRVGMAGGYYGLPQLLALLPQINGITATNMGLTLHFSAYMAESIRAAIVWVDRSQTKAALSIGMTNGQLM